MPSKKLEHLYCLVINPSLHQHHASSVLLMETHRKPEFPFPIDNKESSISFYWGVIKGGLAENEALHHCPPVITICGFPGGSNNKESAYSAGVSGQSLHWEDPLEKEVETHASFLPREFHGQRSLTGYSPWGHKESDRAEQLRLRFH